MRTLSPAEKAFKTRLHKRCWDTVERLSAIPATSSFESRVDLVIAAFKAMPVVYRGAVFMALDGDPGRYHITSTPPWHAMLRSIRNHPEHGPRLFATWGSH